MLVVSGQILFYFKGYENGCGKTRWQLLKEKWSKDKSKQ